MIKRADWETAYREIIAAGRRRLGEPPMADQLFAYSRGELHGEEAARVQELLSFYPEMVRALVEPFPSPEEIRPDDPVFLSDEELERDWQAIQARLIEAPLPALRVAAPTREIQRPLQKAISAIAAFLHTALFRWRLPAVATAVLAVVFGWFLYQTRMEVQRLTRALEEPRINLERRLLLPDGERGAAEEESPIFLRSKADYFLLVPGVINRPPYPDYRLRIVEVTGNREREIWSASGLRREDDTFEVWVPRTLLETGDAHRLELYGLRGKEKVLLATYTIELQES